MLPFLPQDYEVPRTGENYMKFDQGKNTFRVLASPILGYICWNDDENGKRRPVRSRMNAKPSAADQPKHFWAFPVWNYAAKRVQILEITQKLIQESIQELVRDTAWGNPRDYDLVISRSGQSLETKYAVMPRPKGDLLAETLTEIDAVKINLEALFDGEDPFDENIQVGKPEAPAPAAPPEEIGGKSWDN